VKKIIERKQKQMEKIYPGMKCFKDGVRQIPIESIPGEIFDIVLSEKALHKKLH
jgi:hypothetical protein